MTTNITPQATNNVDQTIKDNSGSSEKSPGGTASNDEQGMFDERFTLYLDQFKDACSTNSVPFAVAIVEDPALSGKQIAYVFGDEYKIAKALAKLLRNLQDDIAKQITA